MKIHDDLQMYYHESKIILQQSNLYKLMEIFKICTNLSVLAKSTFLQLVFYMFCNKFSKSVHCGILIKYCCTVGSLTTNHHVVTIHALHCLDMSTKLWLSQITYMLPHILSNHLINTNHGMQHMISQIYDAHLLSFSLIPLCQFVRKFDQVFGLYQTLMKAIHLEIYSENLLKA